MSSNPAASSAAASSGCQCGSPQLYSGRDRQLAGELGPAPLHAVEVTVDIEWGRPVEVAVYLTADGPDVLRGRIGDHQRGQVRVVGEGHRRQAELDRAQARIPHRSLQSIGRPPVAN